MPSTKADPDFEARLCRSQAVDFKLSSFWRTNGGGGGFDVGEMRSLLRSSVIGELLDSLRREVAALGLAVSLTNWPLRCLFSSGWLAIAMVAGASDPARINRGSARIRIVPLPNRNGGACERDW